jgi:hypothetical protein
MAQTAGIAPFKGLYEGPHHPSFCRVTGIHSGLVSINIDRSFKPPCAV